MVLDLSGLNALVEHTAGNLVAVVQAGRPLDDLQDDLAKEGQRLAVGPPRHGTVGGLVAAASTGPLRLFAGPVRDLVIGVTMVRADGVLAKAGGKVVKNVAGYDLGKLLTGSFGTLGVVTQVAFRLHPLAESSQWASVAVGSPTEAQDVVLRVWARSVGCNWYPYRATGSYQQNVSIFAPPSRRASSNAGARWLSDDASMTTSVPTSCVSRTTARAHNTSTPFSRGRPVTIHLPVASTTLRPLPSRC